MIMKTSAEFLEGDWYKTEIETPDDASSSTEYFINYLVTLMVNQGITPEQLTERYHEAIQ